MATDYIPKGKNIKTRHGCTCVNEFKTFQGEKKIKNACTLFDDDEAWCLVKGKCGRAAIAGTYKGKYWDYCLPSKTSFLDSSIKDGPNYVRNNLIGISIFVIIFIITIPTILYKSGYHALLEVYMPNFDLLATAVSYNGGPYGIPIFQELYNPNSHNLLGFSSRLFINYLSLLGLTYLVARRVKLSKSLSKGWAIGFVMLILTYLVPNEFISGIQTKLGELIFEYIGKKSKPPYINFDTARVTPLKSGVLHILGFYFLIVLAGLGVAACFIGLEKLLLFHEKKWLFPFVKHILYIDDFLDTH